MNLNNGMLHVPWLDLSNLFIRPNLILKCRDSWETHSNLLKISRYIVLVLF